MISPTSSLLNNPLSKSFYYHFPTLRTEYTEIEFLGGIFKKIELFSFASWGKPTENRALLAVLLFFGS